MKTNNVYLNPERSTFFSLDSIKEICTKTPKHYIGNEISTYNYLCVGRHTNFKTSATNYVFVIIHSENRLLQVVTDGKYKIINNI